jgi:hypothetical protein
MPRKKVFKQPKIEEPVMEHEYSEHRTTNNDYLRPEAMRTSSVPLDGLREETRDFQPRSREPFSRESDARSDRFINYYEQTVSEAHKGKTHMPQELVPEGYVFMWARESCKGRPDHGNLSELETRHGWEYATASQFPTKAYYDDNGDVQDSNSRVRCGGLIGMIRRKEIHEAQLKQFERLRNSQARFQQQLRTRDGDLHPFSNQSGMGNNQSFFPSDEVSRSFASAF